MDASWPKKAADSFWFGAARCFEQRRISPTEFQLLLFPGVVCLALSIELGMKSILLRAAAPPKTHDLAHLFSLLPAPTQQQIVAASGKTKEAFDSALLAVAKSFQEWRYVYELERPEIDLDFLSTLADAVHQASDAPAA